MAPLPLAATGSHLNCEPPGSLSACDRVFASVAFSVAESGRISRDEVAVGAIGTGAVTAQADSVTTTGRTPMARQRSPSALTGKFISARQIGRRPWCRPECSGAKGGHAQPRNRGAFPAERLGFSPLSLAEGLGELR